MRLLLASMLAFVPGAARAGGFGDVLPGPRAAGMGSAFVAVADDPFGMFYNPAGLAGSDFTQLAGTMGRMLSPLGKISPQGNQESVGTLAQFALAYARPFPFREKAVVGLGFFDVRHSGGDKDEFVFHYSEPLTIPQSYLTKPGVVFWASSRMMKASFNVRPRM